MRRGERPRLFQGSIYEPNQKSIRIALLKNTCNKLPVGDEGAPTVRLLAGRCCRRARTRITSPEPSSECTNGHRRHLTMALWISHRPSKPIPPAQPLITRIFNILTRHHCFPLESLLESSP